MEGAASEMTPPVACKTKRTESVVTERAGSPVPSCVSMKSDRSMVHPIRFREGPFPTDQSVVTERAGSPVPSCVSMKSDRSMVHPIRFREGPFPTDQRDRLNRCNSHPHKGDLSSIFKLLEEKAQTFLKDELMKLKRYLDQNDPECSEPQLEEDNDLDSDGQMQKTCGREGALKITLYILRTMKQNDLADMLEKRHLLSQYQRTIKCNLKKKFECVFDGKAKEGQPTLLKEIYTELYITEGGAGGVNDEHEVRQIETASKKRVTEDTTVKCNDIFKPLHGRVTPIRTVLTKGVAGIGKTVSVQKVILDWAEGKANQDIHFIFALPFRDLNLIKDEYSLIDLLHHFVPELKSLESTELCRYKVLLIFDGLDECRLPLDFQKNESWFDLTKKTSLDVLLTNLIKGNLLPSALLWITSRPAAANQIPPECVHQVTEIRGFSDAQKEEYFSKRFSNKNLASRIITHVKSSRSLFIMCHIPVFCWISATVLERLFSETDKGEIPRTLTEMYTHFLIFQVSLKNDKYMKKYETKLKEYSMEFLLKLGKLAFDNLEKGNLIFYEEDLIDNYIDVTEASVYSGVCTEVFKEEYGLYQEKVYCFVHLSIQEYLAALYVFLSNSSADLLKTAVDQALKSKNGHLDLYLRFLLGLSTDSSKILLQKLLGETRPSSHNIKETGQSIKEKIQENLSAERTINLFHCLNELGDNSLIEEVERYLSSGSLSAADLSPAQWSALAFVLLMSDKELDVFDLKKYIRSDEGLQRLLPVIKKSRTALLDSCRLTETCCEVLASALRSNSSQLRELDLSDNDLQDSGVKLLSAGLGDSQCTLEILRVSGCRVTEEGCSSLASALRSNPSHLRELDLSDNDLQDSGVKLLSAGLGDSQCTLEILRVSGCRVTEEGCSSLASALRSNPSHLRELDLSDSDLQDSGVKLLSAGLGDSHCTLEILRVSGCRVTEEGCSSLASALRSNPSHLRELDLSDNDLQDSGVKLLSAGLGDSHCTLEILRLPFCRVTEEGCSSLASALRSNPSHLRELDLSYNHPGDSGVKLFSALLEDPSYNLEKLNVDHSGECRTRPGIQKYSCQLTLDPNTANRYLSLSEGNRKVTWGEEQPYPDHPERFDYWDQVLCRESLTGRCYWEAEWSGDVAWIGVTYKGIRRKGNSADCELGANDKSWMLRCSPDSYSVCHNNKQTVIPIKPSGSRRVGVYLDWAAGTLSFYRVSSDGVTLLYSFTSSFTEPLCPGFWVNYNSSVSLCMLG
ncbi:NACHT, LRR and PYD domains-containing protein 6-like isoform X1 [Paramormyrops kingsleyae]|uniref:NACHT, LRR and PYD domains-containing protein 6-like isoform X1 n=1 Tax=Paramormyrops kingsleyae TaxID=1676925 RepID=UPI003B97AA00